MGRDALRALIERATRDPDPCQSLHTVTALRAELDAVERDHVVRALAEGRSFTDIAKALGVSRQAAHRRYRHLSGQPPAESRAPGRALITNEVRQAVAFAREEARTLGAGRVGSEHLLLGALRLERSPAVTVLRELGITLSAARENALPTGIVEQSVPDAPRGNGISSYARSVFDQALREAVLRGDGFIGLHHLLAAALRDNDGGACRTVQALGVDARVLRERLQQRGLSPGPAI
jgi:hypothetical protein